MIACEHETIWRKGEVVCRKCEGVWMITLDGLLWVYPHLTQPQPPYGEMCREPNLCAGKGYCPRDPTCGD